MRRPLESSIGPSSAGRPRLRRTGLAVDVERRLFLGRSLSLGALTLLSGCDITVDDAVQRELNAISRWNDRVQAALFNPRRLAPTYPESAVVQDFRYNGYYGKDKIPLIDGESYQLELAGLISDKRRWTLDQL